MNDKIIFLDIDGVVTSLRTGWSNMDIYTVNYLHFVCSMAQCKIVISSTWRYTHGLNFWKSIFEHHLHDDYKTPDLSREKTSGIYVGATRGNEIQMWLNKHPEVKKYLILDDDNDMLPEQMKYFIRTDCLDGLLTKHMQEIKDYWEIKSYPNGSGTLFIHNNMFAATKA